MDESWSKVRPCRLWSNPQLHPRPQCNAIPPFRIPCSAAACSFATLAGRRLLLKGRKNRVQISPSLAKAISGPDGARHPRPSPPRWLLLEHDRTNVCISITIFHLQSPLLLTHDPSKRTKLLDVETWMKGCLPRAMHASAPLLS